MSYPPGPPDPYGQQPMQQPFQQPFQQPMQPPVPVAQTSGKAVLSLSLGIVSLFFCGLLTGIPAIWLGISSRREIKRANEAQYDGPDGYTGEGGYTPYGGQRPVMSGQSLALGGIITGILGTIWSVVAGGLLIALVVFGVQVAQDYDEACDQLRNGQTPDTSVLGEPIGPEDCN
jgi:hypothetical protein